MIISGVLRGDAAMSIHLLAGSYLDQGFDMTTGVDKSDEDDIDSRYADMQICRLIIRIPSKAHLHSQDHAYDETN